MPLLLHLNGPSGVGKSTLARRWADERPGSIDLETDHLALRRIHGHLTAYAEQRPHAHRVVTDRLNAQATYDRVVAAVDGAR